MRAYTGQPPNSKSFIAHLAVHKRQHAIGHVIIVNPLSVIVSIVQVTFRLLAHASIKQFAYVEFHPIDIVYHLD